MLSNTEIKKMMEEGKIDISNIHDVEEQMTPCGVDLTVLGSYKDTSNSEVINSEMNHGQIALEPNKLYHIPTREKIFLSDNIAGQTSTNAEVSLSGLEFSSGIVHPGYEGRLLMSVQNKSQVTVFLEPGEAVVELTLHRLRETPSNVYDSSEKFSNEF